jgi:hypothetical protein
LLLDNRLSHSGIGVNSWPFTFFQVDHRFVFLHGLIYQYALDRRRGD